MILFIVPVGSREEGGWGGGVPKTLGLLEHEFDILFCDFTFYEIFDQIAGFFNVNRAPAISVEESCRGWETKQVLKGHYFSTG